MEYAYRVKPGEKVRLTAHDPADTRGVSHEDAEKQLQALNRQLTALQEMHYAAAHNSILIVLQGLDTAGKDGTIRHVMAQFNPEGCRVESFKMPTPIESAHDFLWRVHLVTPPLGMITIFNRSHYEDVLVARVHSLVPKGIWKGRYGHINDFEALLSDSGTIILKFFLHISQGEQKTRLLAREDDKDKAWKLSASDWPEHALYDEYVDAYEDALSRCSTDAAPWYVVPADHKWFRNLAVARTILDVLEPHRKAWQHGLEARGRKALEARAAQRAAGQAP
jgi:PPK2 family polyphosphate:nucleotide phosphotransferase